MRLTSTDLARYRQQVAAFAQIRPVYEVLSRVITEILSQAVRDLGLIGIVEGRAKTVASFAEKMQRKPKADPVNDFTDLCGVRVITDTKSAVGPVCQFIRRNFEVDDRNSEDVVERLGAGEFGYRSIHFIVSMRPGTFDAILRRQLEAAGDSSHIASAHLARFSRALTPAEAATCGLQSGPAFRTEIQVRTMLQHTWASFYHDRIYKGDFKIPRHYERDARRIAASLEEADDSFSRTIDAVERYRTSYGAYLTHAQRLTEMANIDEVLSVLDPDKSWTERQRLAVKRARIALSLGDAGDAEKTLLPFVRHWEETPAATALREALATLTEAERQPHNRRSYILVEAREKLEALQDSVAGSLLRDFGRALAGQAKPEAEHYLRMASRLDPSDAEAWVILGNALRDREPRQAIEAFEQALRLDPTDPHALAAYLRCKVVRERSLEVAGPLRNSLEGAIGRCRERALAGVYLPHAHFESGFFSLLLGATAPEEASGASFLESLTYYAKGVQLSATADPIERAHEAIAAIQREVDRTPEAFDWVRLFLLAARAGKLFRVRRGARAALEREQGKLADLRKKIAELGGPVASETAASIPPGLCQELAKTEVAAARAQEALATCEDKLKLARQACARETVWRDAAASPQPFVIVAGGCREEELPKIQAYRKILEEGFAEFSGTIFSGGTRAGVCGMVGELSGPKLDHIPLVTYRPQYLPEWAPLHPRYLAHHSRGLQFSGREPIQSWVDMMAIDDFDPGTVRLIGINGGRICSWELRLALAMGAKVGVFAGSGRAASEILADADWADSPGLLRLPDDAATLRRLVADLPPAPLSPPDRLALAQAAHEAYSGWFVKQLAQRDVAVLNWEDLGPELQQSNLQQVDHYAEKLRVIGFGIRPAENRAELRVPTLTREQVEIMAELEHGRWNAERLLAGWKLGPKDVAKKTSPYLVAWDELSEEIRAYDRDAVLAIPARLQALGYEIYPLS
jgi:ppGpp synthetase/RelA/SpoT-type nucleotidyltranferase